MKNVNDKYSPIEYNYLKKDNSYKDIWKVLFFSGYLTEADEEEYKENIKNMNDKMIKITSNKSKLMEIDSNEIQSYKNNLLEKKESNDIIYFKIPNQEFTSFRHVPISNKRKSKKSKKTTESTESTENLASEQESGHGIIDIGFPNEKVKDEYIIIEIKVPKSDDKNSLSEACYLTVADEEEYKENIKNMNKLIIKISSNNPKVVKYGCR
ncbi:hypothetical protein H8356DRAFT_1437809 [Neocallimastix lanati (nom. inval.)]|nr:hypothetical protein H8356DRAFT_1437809 [Neocallimastix sp. JGI-2020a]